MVVFPLWCQDLVFFAFFAAHIYYDQLWAFISLHFGVHGEFLRGSNWSKINAIFAISPQRPQIWFQAWGSSRGMGSRWAGCPIMPLDQFPWHRRTPAILGRRNPNVLSFLGIRILAYNPQKGILDWAWSLNRPQNEPYGHMCILAITQPPCTQGEVWGAETPRPRLVQQRKKIFFLSWGSRWVKLFIQVCSLGGPQMKFWGAKLFLDGNFWS